MADAATVSTVIAAGAGGTAALAAWANVALGRVDWRRSQEPHLLLRIVRQPEGLEVHLTNAGPGVAVTPAWAIASEDEWSGGWGVPHRQMIAADGAVKLQTYMQPAGDDASAVMACRDSLGRIHMWDLDGRHKMMRVWLGRRPSDAHLRVPRLFGRMYPRLDLSRFRRASGRYSTEQNDG